MVADPIPPEQGDGLRQVLPADILVESPDAVTVDAEHVHRHDGAEATGGVVGVDLAALLHDADEHVHSTGVAFAHGDDHLLDGHIGGDAFAYHFQYLAGLVENGERNICH